MTRKEICETKKCRWKAAVLILCGVGLLKEFRPSGPFIVDYAVDHANITTDQMTHEILPATTGSYIVTLIWVLMVTDALCYKPIIVFGALATIATWLVTIWWYDSIGLARLRQIFYGMSSISTEVAYFTYMYANIEKSEYKVVTSYTHSAQHMGQFISGVTGQLLLSSNLLHIPEMNYLSLAGGIGSLIFALFLPRVFRDFTAVKEPENEKGLMSIQAQTEGHEKPIGLNYRRTIENGGKRPGLLQRWKEAPKLAKENFIWAYTYRCGALQYSLWWALAYGLYIQVDLYVESLWKEIEHHSHQKVYNGAVHASHAIISVALGLLIARTKMCWKTWGCLIFGLAPMFQGAALIIMSQTHNLYVAYAGFIIFQTTFQVLVIISKSIVAESVREGSEAFVFGINTLGACVVHLILTMAVTSRHGFKLHIQNQYIVYGIYSIALGVLFLVKYIVHRGRAKWAPPGSAGSSNQIHDAGQGGVAKSDLEKQNEEADAAELAPNSMPYSIPREH